METLENLVTCVICCDILKTPKTLPCLHTLCFKCIQDWNKTCKDNRRRFSCPSCKASVNVPEGDVVNLPTSFHHNSLIQFYNTFKTQTGNSQQLQDCSGCSNRRVAVGFCFQCQGIVCNECYNAHKTVNALKDNHEAKLWSELTKDSINSYMENKAFCKEKFHSKYIIEYYCQTCKKSICQKCILTSHLTHDKISIEEASHLASERLENENARIDQVVEMHTKELQLTRQNKQRMQEEIREEIAKVNKDFDAKIKILQNKQDTIIRELNNKRQEKIKENDEKENTIQTAMQEAFKLRDQCKTMTNMSLKHFILEGYEKLEEVCKATVKDEPILSTSPVQTSVRYIPNPDVSQILKDLELGEIEECVTEQSRCSIECVQPTRSGFINHFSIATRDSKGDECYTNKALIEVNIQDNDGNDVQKEITESQPGQFVVKFRVENPSPYNVAVSIGGKNIKNSPQTISVIDGKAELKPVRFFQTTRISSPVALAMNSKGDIAFVNNNKRRECRIVLYSAGGEYVRDFGGEGTVDSQLNDPAGLAFTNADHILVSDNPRDGGCIKEYHIDGRLLRTVYKQKGFAFTGMCVTSEQSIACLSWKRQSQETSIKLFSKETGNHLQDIKLLAPRLESNPMYITYDNNKYFVSFYAVHSIYVFDENGGILYTIGEKGDKEGQFDDPCGLDVFGAEMLLIICDAGNNRIQLFHQNGVFIRSFGTPGSGLGQIIRPDDVAVAPDGQVFVLDLDGKRIDVFR